MPPAGKYATQPAYEDPYMQYTDPNYVPPPPSEGQATSQTDASTGGGNYAPPPPPAEQPYSYGEPTSYADPHQQQYGDAAALYQPTGPQPVPGGVDYGAPQGGMLVGADAVPSSGGMLVGADAAPTPIPSSSSPEGVNLAQGSQTQRQPAIAPTGQSQDPSVPQTGYKPGQEYLGGSNLWPDPFALKSIAPEDRNKAGLENIQSQPTLNTRKNNYDQLEQQRTGVSNLYQAASGVDPSQGGVDNPFAGNPNTPGASGMYGETANGEDAATAYMRPYGSASPYFPGALPASNDPLLAAGQGAIDAGANIAREGWNHSFGGPVGELLGGRGPSELAADIGGITPDTVGGAIGSLTPEDWLMMGLSIAPGVGGKILPKGGKVSPNGAAKTLGGPEGGPRPTVAKNTISSRPGEISPVQPNGPAVIEPLPSYTGPSSVSRPSLRTRPGQVSPSGSTRAVNSPKEVPSPEVTPADMIAKPMRDHHGAETTYPDRR
jgi:hypothetical protein